MLVAVRSPVKLALLAVIDPRFDNVKKLEDIITSPSLADDDMINVDAEILFSVMINPAIEPLAVLILVALISPSTLAEEAVIAPLLVSLNSLDDINNSWATVEADIANKLSALNLVGSNKNPPIDPLVAVILVAFISPSILADDAVIAPLLETLNKLEDINNSCATVDAEIAKRFAEENLVGPNKNPPIEPLFA